MTYQALTPPTRHSNQNLHILYLDDSTTDLERFERRITQFNRSGDNTIRNSCNVQVTPTSKIEEVIEMLVNKENSEGFDVFVCDHNMPARQGMDFINWLIAEDVNIFYVLYSAGVNVDINIRKECAAKGILFADKTEQISTLIEKLIRETANEPLLVPGRGINATSTDDLYYFIATDIIDDMEKVSDTDYQIRIGGKAYKPADIIHELRNKTEFAIEYVKNYIDGLKFFNKK